MFNALKHDLGLGNIKLETARAIVNRFPKQFPKKLKHWTDLVDYLRSPVGTVHIASLVIKKAQQMIGPYISKYPLGLKEAVLVSYYKQGPIFIRHYMMKLEKDGKAPILPGEGCRVLYSRNLILKALGMKTSWQ